MAKLNLTLPEGELAVTGKQVTFVAPCNSAGLTHIIIGGEEFELVDSNGNALISGAFVKNAMVSVILYTDIHKAYIQNADINAYLDAMFAGDQKPVYAVSETLTDLTSGEKLSTALGKISRAVKDFIAHLANKSNPHSVTKKQVGLEFADNTSDMDKPVSNAQATAIAGAKTEAQTNLTNHNVNTGAHADLRAALTELSNWVKDLLDSDDETLNEMHEVVAYIKSNKALIDAITTSKVSVADIVNDLVTNVANKPLSAAQGVALKALIDSLPTWAKQPNKPSYSASEVGALEKTTYEYNRQLDIGQSGKVCIGKFPMYDSIIAVTINSSTDVTYHGTLVIATQNISTNLSGVYKATVYGDADNSLTDRIKIEYVNGSNVFSVYIDLPLYSKHFLHIQFISSRGEPTDIATIVGEIPSTATIVPTNALYDNYLPKSGGTMTGPIYITGGSATSGALILTEGGQIVDDVKNYSLFGRGDGNLYMGSLSYPTVFRGKLSRPTYNGSDMALASDIPTSHSAGNITAGTFAGQVVANASGQSASVSCLRNSTLSATENIPTVEGEIVWQYE